jgi:hypothetical protein
VLPFGSVAWRVNIMCVLFASAAGALLFAAVALLSGSLSGGVVAVALFSFSRLTW